MAVLGAWLIFCVAIGIAFGIKKDIGNILLAVSMIVATIATMMLWRGWRNEDLDPKFRILIFLMVANILFMGITMNVYVWPKRETPCLNPCPQSKYPNLINPMWWYIPGNKTGVCVEQCPALQCRVTGVPAVDAPCVAINNTQHNRTATTFDHALNTKFNPFTA